MPLDVFLFASWQAQPPVRVPGTAVFMTARSEGAPPILVHHLKHNKALHEQVVLLTVSVLNTPSIGDEAGNRDQPGGDGFVRVIARFGFMEFARRAVGARERARAGPSTGATRTRRFTSLT